MFDLFDRRASGNIGLNGNQFKDLFILILDEMSGNKDVLGVLLHFGNEFANFLVLHLETVHFQVAVVKEEAIVEIILIVHD